MELEPYKIIAVDVERGSSAIDNFAVTLTATVQVNFDRPLTKFEEGRIGNNFDKMAESTQMLGSLSFGQKKLRFDTTGDSEAEEFVRLVLLRAEEFGKSAKASLNSAQEQLDDLQARLGIFVS